MTKVRINKDNFIIEASRIHNNKYIYTKTIYVDCNTSLTIICPNHGEFKQIIYGNTIT